MLVVGVVWLLGESEPNPKEKNVTALLVKT